ncbi:uncharacterized protein BDZ99DRAFT_565297 [Mytilinidion resinicola]|uniref:Uncharacterized protein n=1 Tax=Mytilinidion resinicola TaxID=574789 RepID=A0A6A6ZA09_9PEZI|nr:uncharacterized protein BDZ99DRAFT_565297 [Mytilinidion resinicola]KAF2817573.1 hypothetical protein BDZ99DRAFT_565297 [Mytilinidion resinicola]
MATKLTQGAHAISTLMEQTKRFDAMSVYLSKSADLATSQANEIATWVSKLIDAVTKIQRETQSAAAACRERVQVEIHTLKTQADSTKRKILDTTELDSSRTVKANFRLIFGPPREAEYKSRSTKSVMATNLLRIGTIRGLCESHPHGVIALSTSYPTKVWTESSLEVFDGLIKLVKEEEEQDWPEDIVDIMDELEMERPMCDEFRNLRAKISQRREQRRRRMDDSDGPAPEIQASLVQTGELTTQTPSIQYASGTTQLPNLHQMALPAPSLNSDQTQDRNYRQTVITNSDGTFVHEQRQQPPLCESHHSLLRYEQQRLAAVDSLPPFGENREMKDMYTNAPASDIVKMPEPFRTAVQNSRLWNWERSENMETTGCWPSLFPKDNRQDVSFTIWCGNDDGYRLTKFFGGQIEISS